MKITFLGDSITEGVGASSYDKCYVDRVRQKLDCVVINHGISATRIARQQKYTTAVRDCDFNMRSVLMPKDSDYVFVFGGTNDFGHGDAPFGKIGDDTVNTFCGAVKCLFSTLLNDFGRDKLVIMTPLTRYRDNEDLNPTNKRPLKDYVDVIKHYIKEMGLKHINLYDEVMVCKDKEESLPFFPDGLHPSDLGHDIISDKIVNFIKNDK